MKNQTGLTITKSKQKQALSPSQKTFNRLSKKIEKLQVLLKTTADTLDEKIKILCSRNSSVRAGTNRHANNVG
jgi:hypothetical protein